MLDEPHRGIRRLLAPNPSPMTGPGTNGYILGEGSVAIVDPGPDDEAHLAAWRTTLSGERVSHILVTHAHLDHSGLARRLSDALGAPVVGFGRWDAGRSDTMRRLADLDALAGGEGVDRTFDPDIRVADGDRVAGESWAVEALHVPGHFAGHLAFRLGDVVLTGDHVLGWTSTLISPPDGDLRQFLVSCSRLAALGAARFLPGHGAPIDSPAERLDWLVGHRLARERQIVAALSEGPRRIGDLVRLLYADAPPRLRPAAARNVLAHLVALVDQGAVAADLARGADAAFRLRAGPETAGRHRPPLL